MVLSQDSLLKKIIREDSTLKAELEQKYLDVQEFRKLLATFIAEQKVLSEKVAEINRMTESIPVRIEQLSNFTAFDTKETVAAAKSLHSIYHISIQCQERFISKCTNELAARLLSIVTGEEEKISERKHSYEKAESKYENYLARYSSSTKTKDSATRQLEYCTLQDLRSQYFVRFYAFHLSLCKFSHNAQYLVAYYVNLLLGMFESYTQEMHGNRENLIETTRHFQAYLSECEREKDTFLNDYDTQKASFIRVLKNWSNNYELPQFWQDISAEHSQLVFFKEHKNWKRALLTLCGRTLVISPLGNSQKGNSQVSNTSINVVLIEARLLNGAISERSACFDITTPQTTLVIQGETQENAERWVSLLQLAKSEQLRNANECIGNNALHNYASATNEEGCGSNTSQMLYKSRVLIAASDTVLAVFLCVLQTKVNLVGSVYLTKEKIIFSVEAGDQQRNRLVIPYVDVLWIECSSFRLYDTVKITMRNKRDQLKWKFYGHESMVFFRILRFLRYSTNDFTLTGVAIYAKITEILQQSRDASRQQSFQLNALSQAAADTPTECGCAEHGDYVIYDQLVNFPIDAIYEVAYGETSDFLHQHYDSKGCSQLQISDWNTDSGIQACQRYREANFVIAVRSAFAKEAYCKEVIRVLRYQSKGSFTAESTTETENVPYAGYFSTTVRTCAIAKGTNETRYLVTCSLSWHRWTALKAVIGKQVKDQVQKNVIVLVQDLLQKLFERYPQLDRGFPACEKESSELADAINIDDASVSPYWSQQFTFAESSEKWYFKRAAIVLFCSVIVLLLAFVGKMSNSSKSDFSVGWARRPNLLKRGASIEDPNPSFSFLLQTAQIARARYAALLLETLRLEQRLFAATTLANTKASPRHEQEPTQSKRASKGF